MLITVDFGASNSGASVFYRLLNADKTVAQARSSTGVTELVASTGIYGVEVADSTLRGKTAIWDVDGTALAASETFPDWPAMIRTELATELGRIDATISSRLADADYTAPPSAMDNATAVRTELTTELGYLDAAVSSRLDSTMYVAPPSDLVIAQAVRTELATELGRIDAAITSRLDSASYTTPPTASANATAVRTELATELGRIDATISSRLATSGYTVPPTAAANATAVRAELTTELGRLDAAVSSRLPTASYVAPANADVASIKAKTDSLAFTVAGKVDANIIYVAGRQVVGTGTAGDPWGPAP